MKPINSKPKRPATGRSPISGAIGLAAVGLIWLSAGAQAQESSARTQVATSRPSADDSDSRPAATPAPSGRASIEDTRLLMSKWIESQQIYSKERKDWQQGKEVLAGRRDLVKQEVDGLQEKIRVAEASAAEAEKKKADLVAENDRLKALGEQLATGVTAMEGEVRRLVKTIPEPIQAKLLPLFQRIPEDAAKTKVSVAERFQNVLGILNELNKANNEITVNYEVRTLADGKPAEVKAVYIGLSQAYYVSAGGEAGIGCPTADGWKWEPSKAVASDVATVLEVLDGKHSPAFIPLPVKIQ